MLQNEKRRELSTEPWGSPAVSWSVSDTSPLHKALKNGSHRQILKKTVCGNMDIFQTLDLNSLQTFSSQQTILSQLYHLN